MKKISSLFIALLFIFVAQSVQAYIPIDIPIAIRNSQFTYDYDGHIPPSTLGGIPFHFPGPEDQQTNDFFAFYDTMPNTQWTVNGSTYDTMTMPVTGVTSTTTAYLLLNTNWGALQNAGMVTFNASGDGGSLSISLIGDHNIRDWNSSGGYYGNLDAGSNPVEVFSVTPNYYGTGSTGRIDMLTVNLSSLLAGNEFLTSIVFTDYGSDEINGDKSGIASRIRVEGVTIDGIKSIPEPSTLLLLALGLCVLGFVRTRFSKA